MEDDDRRFEVGFLQVLIELGHLGRDEQPFVDHGPTGERGNVEVFDSLASGGVFHALASQVEASLHLVLGQARRGTHQQLLDVGHRHSSLVAERLGIDRDWPPADHPQTVLLDGLLDQRHRSVVAARRLREKDHANAEAPAVG